MNIEPTKAEKLWLRTCRVLAPQLPRAAFETWILQLVAERLEENTLILVAPFSQFRETVLRRFGGLIANAITEAGLHFKCAIMVKQSANPRRTTELWIAEKKPPRSCTKKSCAKRRVEPLSTPSQRTMTILSEIMEIPPQEIIEEVGAAYGLSENDLCGHGRSRAISIPRKVTVYLCRILTDLHFSDIGAALGGRNHTTVSRAFHDVEALLNKEGSAYDKRIAQQIAEITERLKNRNPLSTEHI